MKYSSQPIDPADVIAAIHAKKGIVAYAAEIVPCCRDTIFKMMQTHPEVKQAVDEARASAKQERIDKNETLIEEAYASTLGLIRAKDVAATIFIMKTLGGLQENKTDSSFNINVNTKPYRDKDNRDSAPVSV